MCVMSGAAAVISYYEKPGEVAAGNEWHKVGRGEAQGGTGRKERRFEGGGGGGGRAAPCPVVKW